VQPGEQEEGKAMAVVPHKPLARLAWTLSTISSIILVQKIE